MNSKATVDLVNEMDREGFLKKSAVRPYSLLFSIVDRALKAQGDVTAQTRSQKQLDAKDEMK